MSQAILLATLVFIFYLSCTTGVFSPHKETEKLRFVAQLTVSGCPIFVHDTGAPDGPHLAVEPLMCVTESVDNLLPRYDIIADKTYVSFTVMMRDDTVLEEVQRQLTHLSPKSVKFARVRDFLVNGDNSSQIQDVEFIWGQEEPAAFLRFGCAGRFVDCRNKRFKNLAGACLSRTTQLPLLVKSFSRRERNRSRTEKSRAVVNFPLYKIVSAINHVLISAQIELNDSMTRLNYQLMLQNYSFINPKIYTTRYTSLKSCTHLRFHKSIRLSNCIARVHQRLDMKGHFEIEPLLCHNITSMTNDSIMYDHSSDRYYLNLDIVLQDDSMLAQVEQHLSGLSPRSVTFHKLWGVRSEVSSVLSRNFGVSDLMVSSDLRNGVLQVFCMTKEACQELRSGVELYPENLWRHVSVLVTSVAPQNCLLISNELAYFWRIREISDPDPAECSIPVYSGSLGYVKLTDDGRKFVVIQQRLKGSVSFQRNWKEYEDGFGDTTDFWIGLSAIHSLSRNGVTLRVEMKLLSGTRMHAEYDGFQVGNASTNYEMTFTGIQTCRSNVTYDAMIRIKGSKFSTKDRDNDAHRSLSCSHHHGQAGWWHRDCSEGNLNGIYGQSDHTGMVWYRPGSGSGWLGLREVRMMLQI